MNKETRTFMEVEDFESMFAQAFDVTKHQEHDQSTHGSWADGTQGGNRLTHRDVYQLQSGMQDTLMRKIYDAEEKYQPNVQRELPKPFPPNNRAEYATPEEYDKAYKAYSKAFDEWSRESTRNIKSTTGGPARHQRSRRAQQRPVPRKV